MSRQDIASHLSQTIKTVSRTMTLLAETADVKAEGALRIHLGHERPLAA
ncbi:hypothetical protein LUX29_04455 [Aureimonas altamirensis]|nr:hypothetical protein [Aureimonas altamirensis]UHD46476.1 hypothetical protein LUX29_04455 [Aureimonas altamirensis]